MPKSRLAIAGTKEYSEMENVETGKLRASPVPVPAGIYESLRSLFLALMEKTDRIELDRMIDPGFAMQVAEVHQKPMLSVWIAGHKELYKRGLYNGFKEKLDP